MKKLTFIAAILIAAASTANAGGNKVKIMHNGNVIEVAASAVPAHLNHGDELMVYYNGQWMTETEYLAALENDYDEVGAESADVEGEEDVEE